MSNSRQLDESGLTCRSMVLADLDQVLEIEAQVSAAPWSRRNFESSLHSHNQCWVLYKNNDLVGYAVLSLVADEAELLLIGIAREAQGHGFGRLLLLHILDCAQKLNARAVFLEVRASNEVAQGLYASEGFNEVGVRPAYYPAKKGREDAVIMALEF